MADQDLSLEGRIGLVTIDFQVDFFEDGPCACDGIKEAALRTQSLARVMRAAGLPIAHILTRHPDKASIPRRDRDRELHYCIVGTPGVEPIQGIVEDGDTLVAKQTYDGFCGTSLEAWINQQRLDHVLLAGVKSSCCVVATGFGFLSRDIPLTVLLDACAPSGGSAILRAIFDMMCPSCNVFNSKNVIAKLREQIHD